MVQRRSEQEYRRLRRIKAQRMKRQRMIRKTVTGGAVFLCLLFVVLVLGQRNASSRVDRSTPLRRSSQFTFEKPTIEVKLLSINPYSRPGHLSGRINGIVIHYTANPGTSASQNRDYFEGLKDSHETKASSHFVVGIEGEIVQCVPTKEIAYASNHRNKDTVSIEACHPKADGKFTEKTYESLVKLTAWLCDKFGLTEKSVIRHFDVTGKKCPLYYVEHEDAWEQFKGEVGAVLDSKGKQEQEK